MEERLFKRKIYAQLLNWIQKKDLRSIAELEAGIGR